VSQLKYPTSIALELGVQDSVVHEPSGLEPARVSCYIQLLVVLNDNGSVC